MSYTPKAFGLVIHLSDKKNISQMKSNLIEFVKKLQSDDKVYVQNPTGLMCEKRGQAVANLAMYRFDPKQALHLKIRDALAALNFEEDHEKIIYVILDTVDSSQYEFEKILNICNKLSCRLVMLGLVENAYQCEKIEKYEDILESYK